MKHKAGKPGLSMSSKSSIRAGKPAGALNPEIQAKIGLELRAMYDEVVKQGVPNRFVDLLKRLDDKQDDERSK